MPTILQDGQYKFIFFSSDRGEPARIPVKHERRIAKFWSSPVTLARNRGFAGHALQEIACLIAKHETELLEAWNDYFGT